MQTKSKKNAPKTSAKESLVSPSKAVPIHFNISQGDIGMKFPEDITEKQWEHTGKELAIMSKLSAFAMGDWLVLGMEKFPEFYKKAADITGLAAGYLKNCKSVATQFPMDERHQLLSFEHHRLLLMIKDETQRAALALRCEKQKLSCAAVKSLIKDINKKPENNTPPTPEQIRMAAVIEETKHLSALQKATTFLASNAATCDRELWKAALDDLIKTEVRAKQVWEAASTTELPLEPEA